MDGQQYLQQISEMNRPIPQTNKNKILNILTSKIFIVSAIGLGLLIIVLIIGSILSGNKTDTTTLSYKLKSHLDSTSEVIQEYQHYIKSSTLRGDSASLRGILSNTSRDLTNYLEETAKSQDKNVSAAIAEEAKSAKEALTDELFEAKINGILDRIYAHKITYEIFLLRNEEAQLMETAKDDKLTEILTDNYNSLGTLYDKFNNFSETK